MNKQFKNNNENLNRISQCIQIINNATKKLNEIQKELIHEYNINNNLLKSIKGNKTYILNWECETDKSIVLKSLRADIDFIKDLKKLATMWMCNYKLQESKRLQITTISSSIVKYGLSGEYISKSLIRDCINHVLKQCVRNTIYDNIGISYKTLHSALVNRIRIFLSNTKSTWEQKNNEFRGKFEIPDVSNLPRIEACYTLNDFKTNLNRQYSREFHNDDIDSSIDENISAEYSLDISSNNDDDNDNKNNDNDEDNESSSSSLSFDDVFGD